MKELRVLSADKDDLVELGKFLDANRDKNGLDPDVFGYPSLEILRAVNSRTIAYLPVQHTMTLESLAPNPESDGKDVALALKQMLTVLAFIAHKAGIREIYFMGSDEETARLAERHGFERLEVPVFRMKL